MNKPSRLISLAAATVILALGALSGAHSAMAGAEKPPPPPVTSTHISPRLTFAGGDSAVYVEVHLPASLPSRFHFEVERNLSFSCNNTKNAAKVRWEIGMVKETTGLYVLRWDTQAQMQGTSTLWGSKAYIAGATRVDYGAGEAFTFGQINRRTISPAIRSLANARVMFEQQRYFLTSTNCRLPIMVQIFPPGK